MTEARSTFYEFFAGGGMARAGLGAQWKCVFANDIDPMKAATYTANWGIGHFVCGDVGQVQASALPGRADLAWASFPCQDLSLAGDGAGLGHATSGTMTRSGTFWPFWALMQGLQAEGRGPRLIVLENVCGVLTSHEGRDFGAICEAFSGAGYRFGAIVVDAAHFVPQSRRRVFFVAVAGDCRLPFGLTVAGPEKEWHLPALVMVQSKLAPEVCPNWLWWTFPTPPVRNAVFADLIEDDPSHVLWHTDEETSRLLAMMSSLNQAKVKAAKAAGRRLVGGIYRRTRPDGNGGKAQRAEVRFDDVSGCLRTPSGGSSRQTVLVVNGERVRSRLLSPREAARLMGLPDEYKLPKRYNDAYHVAGDGVCVPVVRHLASKLLEPIVAANREARVIAIAAE